MRDDDIRELLADRALGLLEADEAARVDAALAASPALRAEAEELRGALYAVPLALEPEPLAPGAWEALAARVRAEDAAAEAARVPEGAPASGPGASLGGPRLGTARANGAPPRPRRAARALAVALAAAVVLLAGSVGWGVLQQRRAALQAHEQAVLAYWMRVPDMRVIPLQTGPHVVAGVRPGVVCVLPDGRALALQPRRAPEGTGYVLYGDTGTGRVELGRTRGTLIEFHADGLRSVELAVPGPSGGVVATASLP